VNKLRQRYKVRVFGQDTSYRPLDGTDRLRPQVCIRVQQQEDKLGLSSAVTTAYISSTQGQVIPDATGV